MTYGERLAAAREKQGLTQKQLAAALGISEGHMIRVENDRGRASHKLSLKAAEVLNDEGLIVPARSPQPSGLRQLADVVARLERLELDNQRRLTALERRLDELQSPPRGRGRGSRS